jgi:hypothetical protein
MEDEKGRPTRLALSAQAWGEPVPHNREDAARLAEKGRNLLGKAKEAMFIASFEELAKLGTISDEQAQEALTHYESLEKNAPTLGQAGRYAALGAVAGPGIAAVNNALRGGRSKEMGLLGHLAGSKVPGRMGTARAVLGTAAAGALSAGAVPLIRHQLDRKAEMDTLKKYLSEHHVDTSENAAGKLQEPFVPTEKSAGYGLAAARSAATEARQALAAQVRFIREHPEQFREKAAFQTSQYDSGLGPPRSNQVSQLPPFRAPSLASFSKEGAGAPTRGNFMMASEIPAFRAPSLDPIVATKYKSASGAITPRGRLSSSMRVGFPARNPGAGTPSIAQVGKPVGFGRPLQGATKGTSGV